MHPSIFTFIQGSFVITFIHPNIHSSIYICINAYKHCQFFIHSFMHLYSATRTSTSIRPFNNLPVSNSSIHISIHLFVPITTAIKFDIGCNYISIGLESSPIDSCKKYAAYFNFIESFQKYEWAANYYSWLWHSLVLFCSIFIILLL